MGGHPFLETPCTICAKPIDLTVDLYADEHGQAVHEHCYIKRVASLVSDPPAARIGD
jgi:hypothetical protein